MSAKGKISRRSAVALGTGALGAGALGGFSVEPAWSDHAPAVVELFTSEGCSSCPPADEFVRELATRHGIIVLSYHVDYWNYLGWRDTLGSSAFSQRQRDYANHRGDGSVYTPQIVVNGRAHAVGSRRNTVNRLIDAELNKPSVAPVVMTQRGQKLLISVRAGKPAAGPTNATIWLATVSPHVSVKIERGENAGKTVAYTNVVRRLIPAGMWHGEAVELDMPRQALFHGEVTSCAVLIQSDGTGPIIGSGLMKRIQA